MEKSGNTRRELERQEEGRSIPGRFCGCSSSPLPIQVDISIAKIHKEVEADKSGGREWSLEDWTIETVAILGLLAGAGNLYLLLDFIWKRRSCFLHGIREGSSKG